MYRIRRVHSRASRVLVATAATAATVCSMAAATSAQASSTPSHLAPGLAAGAHHLSANGAATPRGAHLPAGVPATGRSAFLLKLDTKSTLAVFRGRASQGKAAARTAAQAQASTITRLQNHVVDQLPRNSHVLYRAHSVLAGLAVYTNVRNYSTLRGLDGVTAVYPIAPKTLSNSYAVPLQRAPQAWTAYGDLGAGSTVAVIDTGVDYTHADLGGPGTAAAYDTAHAAEAAPADPALFPNAKVIGGYDFAGDDYNADPASPDFNPVPAPDPNPLDCNGHGSHVAGTIAGYGENADGSTYTGTYDTNTPFGEMRIGPGVAPEAKLYAYRVFGCAGSTNLVGEAIDRAADPNGDGDPSDHVNVINMSLGSDYGSPNDGDSVAANDAAAMGITLAIASGNAGDLYDVGGSPGDATRAIAVAATADAQSVVDSLNVTAPDSIAGSYAAERSIAYDWAHKPDLAGDVVKLTDPTNLDGCQPYSTADTALAAGKIVFLEWTDNDATRRCGSVARGGNAVAAGAVGFVFADDEENFAAGITGSATIPGVIVAKSGGDAIRSELQAGHTVTIGGTTMNGFTQIDPSQNDQIAAFSSRGIGDAGNVKPDVAAVGLSVFSVAVGTGNKGMNDSGTSMATPMVAGTAALVTSAHPAWTPEQVKADIMNTAEQDVFVGPNHTGAKYAPNRVGAGRIDVKAALDNGVLAYNKDDAGAVSLSFGTIEATAPMTLTKTVKVQNTTLQTRTYNVSYTARSAIPGATYTFSPDSVTLDPRASQNVTVTLTIDPSKLTKTIDPTVARTTAGLPREYKADASGLLLLTDANDSSAPVLRVPVYSAPRPASQMTQPSSVTLPRGSVQEALLKLSGQRVNQGSGATAIRSTVAGFELVATSGMAPQCSATVADGCVNFPDERSADLKYVGITTDAPQLSSVGQNPNTDGMMYVSVTTQGPWRTAAGIQEFDVFLDTNGDGTADFVAFNTRLSGTDILVADLYDLAAKKIVDIELINNRFGDTDTALFDSDTMVLPIWLGALNVPTNHRLSYGVASFSGYQSAPIDAIGFGANGEPDGSLQINPLRPGIAVYGSYDGDNNSLLYRDSPGSVLEVRRDVGAYNASSGKGVLMVHFHNLVGAKAQVMAIRIAPATAMKMTPRPAQARQLVSATVTVPAQAGMPATGSVTLVRTTGAHAPAVVARGTLNNGTATLQYVPASGGTYSYRADYAGDAHYAAGHSSVQSLVIRG